MDIAVHINPALAHQREHGELFRRGFAKHGLLVSVTAEIHRPADVHVVSGCWYAQPHWIGHPRVVWLDRCYYKGDPDHVSVGWMRSDGGRDFVAGEGREPPEARPLKGPGPSIFLADYNGPVEQADTVRLHPAAQKYDESLSDALSRHSVAIGYTTTALVTAALAGLSVICKDSRHIMNRPDWREVLPWADWHKSEIESGELWEHLASSLPQR